MTYIYLFILNYIFYKKNKQKTKNNIFEDK